MEGFNDLAKYDDHGGISEESRNLDFHDVFGGPPRGYRKQDGDGSLWDPVKVKVKEKEVFREERVVRRRHHSDDFYDDIFRGDERYGLPWRSYHDHDRGNLFGSRLMSLPARRFGPESEPFGSVPAELGLVIRDQDDININMIQGTYNQRPLCNEASSSTREDLQYNIVQNSKNHTESVRCNNNEFHFSIYKWVDGGVSMISPHLSRNDSRSQDNRKCDYANSSDMIEIKPSSESLKMQFEVEDSKDEKEMKEFFDQYCFEEVIFDSKENVAFEINHLPDLDQPGSLQVLELSEDLEEVLESGEASEGIKGLDDKIRQWSSGKKENIRSLLSTLQYVLWDGSGWKAIALVDLIETNSVKRAYQKALLRLHPDKLQHQNVASHHKYIAQKVFDILQEAWDHFNTLAPL